jgi:4-hydroxy-4-methyl-2-oxoglutarate aldolase
MAPSDDSRPQPGEVGEQTLVGRLGALFVAVISHALDQVGVRINVMGPWIRPLKPGSKVAGVAATLRLIEVDRAPTDRAEWYRGEIEALEAMREGDVMVASTCPGSFWGELLATACVARGVRGVVADAYTRDSQALMRLDFPTFVSGINAQDSLGRVDVEAHGVPIRCGGVVVVPGDLILADHDGVVVIPSALAGEVIARAEAKVAVEGDVRAELRTGTSLAEVFALYETL